MLSKLGFVLPYWADVTLEDLVHFSKLGDDLGYDSVWVPEMWGRDAFSLISTIAANTKKLKMGTAVISVYSRSPALIAQTAATIDEYSQGRMILGIGMSSIYLNENWHSMKFEKPLLRTRESVEVIREILEGEKLDYEGEIFSLKYFKLLFKPYRKNLPIYIASLGPKNIKLTSEIADGWLPFMVSNEFINSNEKVLRSKNKDMQIAPFIPALISKDPEESKFYVKELIALYVASMGDYYHKQIASYGFKKEADDVKKFWRKDKERAIDCVTDEILNLISIYGDKDSGSELLEKFSESSDLPILMFPPKAPKELIEYSMKEFI